MNTKFHRAMTFTTSLMNFKKLPLATTEEELAIVIDMAKKQRDMVEQGHRGYKINSDVEKIY